MAGSLLRVHHGKCKYNRKGCEVSQDQVNLEYVTPWHMQASVNLYP